VLIRGADIESVLQSAVQEAVDAERRLNDPGHEVCAVLFALLLYIYIYIYIYIYVLYTYSYI